MNDDAMNDDSYPRSSVLYRQAIILALGFSSGLPLALTFSTLTLWLASVGIDKNAGASAQGEAISNTVIGLFALASLPYSFKFLWSPLVDCAPFPVLERLLGRRRGWLAGTQLLLAGAIFLLGFSEPGVNLWATAMLALLVATLSATQDIVIDAFRIELLPREQQGIASAASVLGYRLGMIASSAGALFIAADNDWKTAYLAMAACMGVGLAATLLAPREENPLRPADHTPRSLAEQFRHAVIDPFRDFMSHQDWLLLLAFVLLYRLADAFLGVMANPFYKHAGFPLKDIAEIAKLFGLAATIAGGFAGGWVVRRAGLTRALWIGGLLSLSSNLLFIPLEYSGAHRGLLAAVITMDNVSSGVATTALVAWMSSLCNRSFTATQYALLSSLSAAGRNLSAGAAGLAADMLGWPGFFMLSAALGVPALLLLRKVQPEKK